MTEACTARDGNARGYSPPATDVDGQDALFHLVVQALHRLEPGDKRWESGLAAEMLSNARVRRISRSLAFQYPIESDEVHQQLAVTMLQKLRAQDFDAPSSNDLFALIAKIGERHCIASSKGVRDTRSLDQLREQAAAHGSSDPMDADDEGQSSMEMERATSLSMSNTRSKLRDYMHERHNLQESHHSQMKNDNIHIRTASDHVVERKNGKTFLTRSDISISYLNVRLENVDALLKRPPGRPPGTTSGGSEDYNRNAEQQELFNYWQASGLSQENFAASIDVSLAAFKSYIYRKTKDVPTKVIAKAREYQAKTESLSELLHKRFDMPMKEILAQWEKKLGLTEARDEDVATILGINHTTVMRWRKDETRPKARDLARYEMQIIAYAAQVEETRKKASEQAPRARRSVSTARALDRATSPARK